VRIKSSAMGHPSKPLKTETPNFCLWQKSRPYICLSHGGKERKDRTKKGRVTQKIDNKDVKKVISITRLNLKG